MKEEELDLLHRYLDGGILPEELETLEELLRTNAEARSTLRSLATIDAKWQELETKDLVSQSDEERVVEGTSFRPAPGWLSWRPLTSAAAGIIMGVLTTSIMWAYTVPQTPEVSHIEIPLVDPGFEETDSPVPAVIPRALNRWNGDASHAVSSGDSVVKPKQGRFMMKMQPVEDRRYSRIEQIVDVSQLVPAEGGAVEFSASIVCDGAVNQSRMLLVLRAFTMGADEIGGSTEKLDDQVTSEARKRVLIPAGSTDWQAGSMRMDLPANTKTLVFSIVAVDLREASASASRYIDDVKARIVTTQPARIQK